jgi:hypothetical protein
MYNPNKRVFILIILFSLFLAPLSLHAQAQTPLGIHIETNSLVGIQLGVEYSLSDRLGITASAGISIIEPRLIGYNLYGTVYLVPPEKRFLCNLNFGTTQNVMLFNIQHYSWGFGVGLSVGYRFKNDFRIALRGDPLFRIGTEEGTFFTELYWEAALECIIPIHIKGNRNSS